MTEPVDPKKTASITPGKVDLAVTPSKAMTSPSPKELAATPSKEKGMAATSPTEKGMARRTPLADTNTNPILYDGARRPYQIASVESISGTVAVANFPATQPVSGSVSISGPVTLSGPPVDRSATGTIGALNATLAISTQGGGNVGVQISGTFNATLAFEATVDGTTWIPASLVQQGVTGSGSYISQLVVPVSTTTTLRGMVGGFAQFRVRASAYTSGTATVALELSETATSVRAEQAVPAVLANAWPVQITDGTNTMPTGDVAARAIFKKVTDGTNTAAVKAASTAAAATDPSLVVALHPSSPVAQGTAAAVASGWPVKVTDGTNTMPTGDVAARAAFRKVTDGTNTAAVKAASTAAAATDPSLVVALHPSSPVTQGTAAAVAGSWPVKITDGTNTMPAGDTAARAGYERITDGTNTAAVKAASTAAVATDPALVVAVSPGTPVVAVGAGAPASVTVGNPVLMAGTDSANTRTLLTDANGRQLVAGAAAAGAVNTSNPLKIGGMDPASHIQNLQVGNDLSLLTSLTNNQQLPLSNATVTASGSATYVGVGHKEVNLIINCKSAPTGTLPTLTFQMQEVDPGDQTTAIGSAVVGAAITAAGTQTLKLPDTVTGCVKVTWTIGGTATPSFTNVYATVSVKPTEDIVEQYAPLAEDNTNGVIAVTIKPVAVGIYAWTSVFSTALAASLIIKAAGGVLRQLRVRLDSTAGSGTFYIQLFNSTTLPVDTTGTATMLVAPIKIQFTTGTDQTLTLDYTDAGIAFATGLVVVLSSTEFTKTIAGAFLSMTALIK